MPDEPKLSPARRRRRARRRRAVVIGIVAIVVLGGGGTAYALTRSSGPSYRTATVVRGVVSQTVDADGTLDAKDQSTLDFAASGTVSAVKVAVGDHVTAGQLVATLDPSTLQAAVTTARATLSRAKQTLSSDETAQPDGTSSTTSSGTSSGTASYSGAATDSAKVTDLDGSAADDSTASSVELLAATSPTVTPAQIRADQKAVVTAQEALDTAVDDLSSSCTTSTTTETTQSVAADSNGTVSGTVGDDATVVTIGADGTTSDNPQTVAAGGTYSFAGLTSGTSYKVVLVPVVNNSACASAITAVQTAKGSATGTAGSGSLYAAIDTLNADIAELEAEASSSGSGSGSGPTPTPSSGSGSGSGTGSGSTSKPSGSAPSGSTSGGSNPSGSTPSGSRSSGSTSGGSFPTSSTGSGSTSSGSTSTGSGSSSTGGTSSGVAVTAEQIAADAKDIDADRIALAVARNNVHFARLTSPISGTVGAGALAKGDSVSASSSTDTITVVGDGTLSVDVSVSLADIDLIKVGETAAVTVDGRSEAVPAKVTLVGVTNSSDSTGSSAAYTVTVDLDATSSTLYDGMGASVAIDVGTATHVVTVPISALHTEGTADTVDVYAGGKVTATRVTTGVQGADLVQIKSGLTAGQKIVLADLGAAIPSSTTSTGGTRNSLTSGLTGSSGGFTGGGFGGGGPGN